MGRPEVEGLAGSDKLGLDDPPGERAVPGTLTMTAEIEAVPDGSRMRPVVVKVDVPEA